LQNHTQLLISPRFCDLEAALGGLETDLLTKMKF
jgi:hypothetical protein